MQGASRLAFLVSGAGSSMEGQLQAGFWGYPALSLGSSSLGDHGQLGPWGGGCQTRPEAQSMLQGIPQGWCSGLCRLRSL